MVSVSQHIYRWSKPGQEGSQIYLFIFSPVPELRSDLSQLCNWQPNQHCLVLPQCVWLDPGWHEDPALRAQDSCQKVSFANAHLDHRVKYWIWITVGTFRITTTSELLWATPFKQASTATATATTIVRAAMYTGTAAMAAGATRTIGYIAMEPNAVRITMSTATVNRYVFF